MNAYAVTIVTGKTATFHYCGPHTYDAMKKAMVITGTERECHLHYPPVGDIVLTCGNTVPVSTEIPQEAPVAGPGHGRGATR